MYDIYVDEDISIRAEVDDFCQVVLHMDVFNWNKSTLRKSKRLAVDAKEALRLEGFSTAYTITPNPKFVKSVFGGEVMDKVRFNDIDYEVIVWDLK